jgi:hypothetical protein
MKNVLLLLMALVFPANAQQVYSTKDLRTIITTSQTNDMRFNRNCSPPPW